MNKQVFNYTVYPAVVRANTETTIRIHALGENTRFLPHLTYTVEIRGVETHCSNYANLPVAVYHATPNDDGDLEITHHFIGEQRHALTLKRPQEDLENTPYRHITHRCKRAEKTSAVLYV